jgi:hypothetical protein
MAKKQETLTLFAETYASTRKLSDTQFGVLMRAAFQYRFEGISYSGDDSCVDLAFQFVSNQIDRYQEACDSKSEAAYERERRKAAEKQAAESQDKAGTESTEGHKRAQKAQKDTKSTEEHSYPIQSVPIQSNPILSIEDRYIGADKPPTRSQKFVPPALEEVKKYCQERKNGIDPEKFLNYYQSNGWMVGKSKMKDWKAAVRTWEKNGYESARKNTETPEAFKNLPGVTYC